MNQEINGRGKWAGFGFFKTSPRLNRVQYFALGAFWTLIPLVSVCIILFLQTSLLLQTPLTEEPSPILSIIVLVLTILLFIIGLLAAINLYFLMVRRLHDFNLRGWWLLLTFIPVLGAIWNILILLIPGTEGSNRFGEQPQRAAKAYIWLAIISLILLLVAIIFFALTGPAFVPGTIVDPQIIQDTQIYITPQ